MDFTEIKNTIRAKAPLADFIGQSVKLKKAGGRYFGLCPFHEEKTPSFTVFDDRYFCFGCKASGDIIEFVRKSSGSSFIEAVHLLGARYGVDTTSLQKNKKRSSPRPAMHEALLKARDFFHNLLKSAAGQRALAYLQRRGVSEEEISTYKLGYASSDLYALRDHLRKQGVTDKTAVDASLLKDGRDFFRSRIMFPIYDGRGQVVGFGGRTSERNNKVKYLNSGESELFHKSKVLFGLWHAAQAIAAQKIVLVVEGYFDWLSLRRAGIEHCVACMGTALTAAQLRALPRQVETVILLFDGDRAGIAAARHVLPLVFEFPQLAIKVAALPQQHDPDSILKEKGMAALQKFLQQAEDVVEFSIIGKLREQEVRNYPKVLREVILPQLREIKDELHRGTLIAQIADYSGISRDAIAKGLRRPHHERKDTADSNGPRVPMWLREFFGHLYYAEPQTLDLPTLQQFMQQELALAPAWQDLLEKMLDNLQHGTCNCAEDALSVDELDATIKGMLATVRKYPTLYGTDHQQALVRLMLQYKEKKLKAKIALLQRDLHRADEPRMRELLPVIYALQQEKIALTQATHVESR